MSIQLYINGKSNIYIDLSMGEKDGKNWNRWKNKPKCNSNTTFNYI
jgi:hypothetical protein